MSARKDVVRWSKVWNSAIPPFGTRGHLKKICKYALRVARAVQETRSSEMLGGQQWFPEGGDTLEHQIFRFAKMICATGATLLIKWWKAPNTLVRRRQLCTQLSIFDGRLVLRFRCCQLQKLRTSRRLALCLTLCCRIQKLRMSHRIAEFLMLSR